METRSCRSELHGITLNRCVNRTVIVANHKIRYQQIVANELKFGVCNAVCKWLRASIRQVGGRARD